MTYQDKAQELIEKYKKATTYEYQEYAGAHSSTFEHDIETIKECAIIHVDEILQLLEFGLDFKMSKTIEFYQQVKNELTK